MTQLVNDINVAVVNADIAFLERVLHQDYVHYGHRGTVENRPIGAQVVEYSRLRDLALVLGSSKHNRIYNTESSNSFNSAGIETMVRAMGVTQ